MYVVSGIGKERNEEYLVDNYTRPNRGPKTWTKDIDFSIERMIYKLHGVDRGAISQLVFNKEQ
jgi:hypothetical protein